MSVYVHCTKLLHVLEAVMAFLVSLCLLPSHCVIGYGYYVLKLIPDLVFCLCCEHDVLVKNSLLNIL